MAVVSDCQRCGKPGIKFINFTYCEECCPWPIVKPDPERTLEALRAKRGAPTLRYGGPAPWIMQKKRKK